MTKIDRLMKSLKNNKEENMKDTGRLELSEKADHHRAKFRSAHNDVIDALTFKQYQKMPKNLSYTEELVWISAKCKSKKMARLISHAEAAHTAMIEAIEEYKAFMHIQDANEEHRALSGIKLVHSTPPSGYEILLRNVQKTLGKSEKMGGMRAEGNARVLRSVGKGE